MSEAHCKEHSQYYQQCTLCQNASLKARVKELLAKVAETESGWEHTHKALLLAQEELDRAANEIHRLGMKCSEQENKSWQNQHAQKC